MSGFLFTTSCHVSLHHRLPSPLSSPSSSSSCCIFPVNALARPSRYRGTIEIVTPMAGRLISRCNRETSISVPLSPPLLADPGSLGVDASAINMKAACRIVALIHPTIHSLHRRYPAVIRELAGTRRPVVRTELGSNGTSASPIVHLRASSQHPSPGRYKSLISRTGSSSKTRSLGHRAAYRFASSLLFFLPFFFFFFFLRSILDRICALYVRICARIYFLFVRVPPPRIYSFPSTMMRATVEGKLTL